MRRKPSKFLEEARTQRPPYVSPEGEMYGAFLVKHESGSVLNILSSGRDTHWEHVSVSTIDRCPTWDEMHFVKRLFWEDSETVMQLHPPEANYVNCHPFCLHMWKPVTKAIPLPPQDAV